MALPNYIGFEDRCINEVKCTRGEASRFLSLLDPGAHDFIFQTFDDNRCNGHDVNGSLARSTSDRAEVLRLYEKGAGVYVTINETDLIGRKSENIKRIRAIWQEDDDGYGGPFPLDPSLVIKSSPGHFHRYWLVADHWPADEQGRADFASVMERMVASYGSDHRARDISRVLRLPGFLHRKDAARPHMVRIVTEGGRRYAREEILRAFPPIERETRQEQSMWGSSDSDEERIADALRVIPADDRDIWLQVGMALKADLGESGRALWDKWSPTSSKFNPKDQEKTWRSFKRNGIGIGTLFWHAQRNGWSPPLRDNPGTNAQSGLRSSTVVSVVSDSWPAMDQAAYQGLAGNIVDAIEPQSEADPVAILVQTLAFAGNVMGRTAYYRVEDDRHHTNLNGVLVGESSKARKGTSMGRVRAVAKVADERWSDDRLKGGLSSGEGLINQVRDERREWDKKKGREEIVDPGIADKRLMVVEPEFASVLAVAQRQGNTLSELIRRAWDGDKLSTMTKQPLHATGAHISIIGHITIDELRARLTRTETANGFANRFLFALVRRSKELPFGGSLDVSVTLALGERLREKAERAKTVGRVEMTDAAQEQWKAVYSKLSEAQPGLLGAVVARGEAQVVRLALIYALLDGTSEIDVPHLQAALAVWEYCESSAAFIFGDLLGDPVADEIMRALQHAGPEGMNRTAIRDLFGRNRSGDRIGTALALLARKGRARMETRKTSGHPAEVWVATAGR